MRNATIVSLFLFFSAFGPVTAHAQDGSIVAWGDNHLGECDVPARNHRFPTMEALMEAVRQFLIDLSPIELSSPLPFRVTRNHGLVLAESK